MYPVNQVILGGESMFNNIDDIDTQIQKMEAYRQKLKQLKDTPKSLIWDRIDAEISPLSSEQKNRLLQNKEYLDTYNEIQSLVQLEILNLVKGKIENTERGRELLNRQLNIVRSIKGKIIEETNREMELFNKFKDKNINFMFYDDLRKLKNYAYDKIKEYSKIHPNTSYDEFLKSDL